MTEKDAEMADDDWKHHSDVWLQVLGAVEYLAGRHRLGLPQPMQFFFLACILFYFLSQVAGVNPYIGIFGALAFAYSTYNPVIISAGHVTKMWCIAYMPAMLASLPGSRTLRPFKPILD